LLGIAQVTILTLVPSPAPLPAQPDVADALRYFGALFPEPGLAHFRSVAEPKDGRPSNNHHYQLGAGFETTIREFLAYCQADGRAAYVLPGYVTPGGTGKADVVALWTVVVDLDKGDTEANLAQLEEAIGPATVIVESGGTTDVGTAKLHAYWRLGAKATGPEIDRVCAIREALAERFGGDTAFKQAAQVIRIPGSIHFKGSPRPVRLRTVRPGQRYSLDHIAAAIGLGRRQTVQSQPIQSIPGFLDFTNVTVLHSDVDRVMTAPIHAEGVDDVTRFEGASIALGHFIRQVREGRMTEDQAWDAAKAWNLATLVPPWPEDRLRQDWRRLRALDIKANGPLIAPEPILEAETPEGWTIFDWRADRFVGPAPERVWLVDNLIPRSTPGLLAAVGDAGKSMLALNLALAVTGQPSTDPLGATAPRFFGQRVMSHGAAVVLTAEDDEGEVHRRLNALDPTGARKDRPLYVIPMISTGGARAILVDGPQGPQPTEFWHELCRQLETIPDLALVVFDPLSSFVGSDINKDNLAGASLMAMEAGLAARTGAAVMNVHHFAKGRTPTDLSDARDAVRGASALVDNGRWAIALWEAPDEIAEEALKALDREVEIGRAGIVYQGGLTKGNAGEKRLRTLVRNLSTGLLEDVTDVIRAGYIREPELIERVYAALCAEKLADYRFAFPIAKNRVQDDVLPYIRRHDKGLIEIGRDRVVPVLNALLTAGKIKKLEGKTTLYEPVLS
jgi:hypothetical protein